MNDSMTSELRALRARAYGPDADLHENPAALDRLRQLEEIARGGTVDSSWPPRDTSDTQGLEESPPETSDAPEEPPAGHADLEETETVGGLPPKRWRTGRAVVALVAGIAIAVVVTAAITSAVSRRVQADPREVAVLGVDQFATLPKIFQNWQCGGEECEPGDEVQGSVYTEFYGLSAFTMPGEFWGAEQSTPCLMIVESSDIAPDADATSFDGRIYSGCGAGEFPPIVQLSVSSDLPEELREQFPEGSGLQFTLDGDEVVVLADTR